MQVVYVILKLAYANLACVWKICIQRAYNKYRIINTAMYSIAETVPVTGGGGESHYPAAIKDLNENQAQIS